MKRFDCFFLMLLIVIAFPFSGCSHDRSIKQQHHTYSFKNCDTIVCDKFKLVNSLSTVGHSKMSIYPIGDNDSFNIQQQLLKSYLEKYSEIESHSGFVKIPKIKKNLLIGDTNFSIKLIKQFLFQTDDIALLDTTPIFDTVLLVGIKSFQSRMGYQPTGHLSTSIIAEMNVPAKVRMKQMERNIEKFKKFNPNQFSNYLLVNIPEFKLHLYESNRLLWSMKIIVGKTSHPTAVFENKIQYVVFSPYWNVPRSILINELMPLINHNKKYLSNNNMEWVGGNLRQRPGPDNPLGLVKFLFPNKYNMYLHDTPAKSLFSQNKRTFSHGCIRIAEAKKLAEYLLKNDPDWNKSSIQNAMNARVERFVKLKKPLPIFIAYFTSWIDEEGKLQFRKDIYNKENNAVKQL